MSYPEFLMTPMRQEPTQLGVRELRAAAEVDESIRETQGTLMIVVNSVAGQPRDVRQTMARRYRIDHGLLGCGLVLALAMVATWPALAQSGSRVPQIEVKAPSAFGEGARQPSWEHRVRYRVDATVVFPLFSIPLAHRDNVGFVSTIIQDFQDGSGDLIRTYELFSASFPDRARGLNRMGFIREAVAMGPDGVRWTAHFGALSSNPEESQQEVTLEGDETLQSYTVMNGFTDRTHTSNTDVRLQLEGTWKSPTVFYDTLIPAWRVTVPDTETLSRPQAEVPSMEPLGFLGIVVKSLRVAAMDVERASSPQKFRYPFAYRGELTYLVLGGHGVDGRRHQRYVADGLVQPDATVHRLDYRILDREGGLVQRFRVWTELLPGQASEGSVPVFPLAFEFKAKSFLKLHAVRVTDTVSK